LLVQQPEFVAIAERKRHVCVVGEQVFVEDGATVLQRRWA